MNITAIIPARSGSKRIPNKNVKELNGMPLVAHTIIAASVCKTQHILDRVVVTSDSEEVAKITWGYENAEFLQRPPELCDDAVTDFPVIHHAVCELDLSGLIVYLRPTTPIRALYHIEEAIKTISRIELATGLRSVELMSESAFKCFTISMFKKLEPVFYTTDEAEFFDMTDKPNQLVEPTYKPNGYVDIARTEQILAGQLWGDQVIGYITPRTVEIDTIDDWEYAAWMMGRHVEQNLRFGRENT